MERVPSQTRTQVLKFQHTSGLLGGHFSDLILMILYNLVVQVWVKVRVRDGTEQCACLTSSS